jgi:hypothetical protein
VLNHIVNKFAVAEVGEKDKVVVADVVILQSRRIFDFTDVGGGEKLAGEFVGATRVGEIKIEIIQLLLREPFCLVKFTALYYELLYFCVHYLFLEH